MNKLSTDKQITAISALVEGNSIRSIERMTGIHRDTIMRLMVRVGNGCERLMDATLRDLPCENVQVDEIWSFVGKKQRHVTENDDAGSTGAIWTYVALDRDTKLVPAYLVGKRNIENTRIFIDDLASRLTNRVQLSTDSLPHYANAIDLAFGGNVDYAQIVKAYEAAPLGPGRYSPPKVVSTRLKPKIGNPDRAKISTSHVERQNLTMRMCMRRFTRLTNGFSKKLENMKAAVHLHFAYYNFVRVHQTLKVTPAMEAGLSDSIYTIGDLLEATAK
jgi:IS1 family transposase